MPQALNCTACKREKSLQLDKNKGLRITPSCAGALFHHICYGFLVDCPMFVFTIFSALLPFTTVPLIKKVDLHQFELHVSPMTVVSLD